MLSGLGSSMLGSAPVGPALDSTTLSDQSGRGRARVRCAGALIWRAHPFARPSGEVGVGRASGWWQTSFEFTNLHTRIRTNCHMESTAQPQASSRLVDALTPWTPACVTMCLVPCAVPGAVPCTMCNTARTAGTARPRREDCVQFVPCHASAQPGALPLLIHELIHAGCNTSST